MSYDWRRDYARWLASEYGSVLEWDSIFDRYDDWFYEGNASWPSDEVTEQDAEVIARYHRNPEE